MVIKKNKIIWVWIFCLLLMACQNKDTPPWANLKTTENVASNPYAGLPVAWTTTDIRDGTPGFLGVGESDQTQVTDFDAPPVKLFIRLNGKNSPMAVGSGFDPRLHPSYGEGADNGRNSDAFESLPLVLEKGEVYSVVVGTIPNGGTFRFALSLKGGPAANQVTHWAFDLPFDSAYFEERDSNGQVQTSGLEFYYIELRNRIYFHGEANAPPPNAAPIPPPTPLAPPSFHFAGLTPSGESYQTYDLLISGLNQGESSDPATTAHGFVFLEYLGVVNSNNLRVRVYWFLGNGPMGENNTPLPSEAPQLFREYDVVAANNRPPEDYNALAFAQMTGTDLWSVVIETFPLNGKIFFNASVDGTDPRSNSTKYVRGLQNDSAHDATASNRLGFWWNATHQKFHSLHN